MHPKKFLPRAGSGLKEKAGCKPFKLHQLLILSRPPKCLKRQLLKRQRHIGTSLAQSSRDHGFKRSDGSES